MLISMLDKVLSVIPLLIKWVLNRTNRRDG